MKHLQKYQAFAGDEHERVYKEQIVVGDQLSVERGTNAQFQLSNGFTPEQRFENLHFETADFHALMIEAVLYSNHAKFRNTQEEKHTHTSFVG
jgi:hypothetical protein